MADYYPLISRSIESLGDPTSEMRQSVYDRAKQALIEQLRLMDPPMLEIDIMRERLALESTIRRFERTFITEQRANREKAVIEDHPVEILIADTDRYIPQHIDVADDEPAYSAPQLPLDDVEQAILEPQDTPDLDNESHQTSQNVEENKYKSDEKFDSINLYVDNLENKQIFLLKNIKNVLKNRYFYRVAFILIVLSLLSFAVIKIAQLLESNQTTLDALNTPNREEVVVQADKKIEEKAPVIPQDKTDQAMDILNRNESNSNNKSNNQTSNISNVEQRALFVEESSNANSEPVRIEGQVIWKLETYPSSVGGVSDTGARATITVKEIGLTADIVIRQNKDQDSANSHMIEVKFTTDANSERGKVRDIGIPELRSDENIRGAQLAGIPVPVTDNVFLIGMNALPVEAQKNLELLRTMNWTLLPVRFANGKRAALLFEKGKTGNRVIEDTFQTWK